MTTCQYVRNCPRTVVCNLPAIVRGQLSMDCFGLLGWCQMWLGKICGSKILSKKRKCWILMCWRTIKICSFEKQKPHIVENTTLMDAREKLSALSSKKNFWLFFFQFKIVISIFVTQFQFSEIFCHRYFHVHVFFYIFAAVQARENNCYFELYPFDCIWSKILAIQKFYLAKKFGIPKKIFWCQLSLKLNRCCQH